MAGVKPEYVAGGLCSASPDQHHDPRGQEVAPQGGWAILVALMSHRLNNLCGWAARPN